MLEVGYIEDVTESRATANEDHRRRYYRLTRFGRSVASAEAGRLAAAVAAAESKRLLRPG